jgi:uncharacterized protein YjbJ (UPF0337 family)
VANVKRSKSKKARREVTGRVEEALGFATGDRRVEAEGHIRHRKAELQGAKAPISPEEVTEEERRVRKSHGDLSG